MTLFARLFWVLWVAMVLVTAGFVGIVALTFSDERMHRRIRRLAESLELHGGRAARAVLAGDPAGATAALARLQDREAPVPVGVFRDGRVVVTGGPPLSPAAAEVALLGVPSENHGDLEIVALALSDVPGFSAAMEVPRPTLFSRPPEFTTVAGQMALVVIVSGAVAFILARRLARPIQALRTATGRVAAGELEVRVGPSLEGSPIEIAALGQDFDRMTERVATLLEVQRRLLRDVSHELRSPLARLEVALEMARDRAGEPAQPLLDRIGRETERLGALIAEVLTLSRLEAEAQGSGETPIEVDLRELVHAIVLDADFESKARNRGVRFVGPKAATLRGRPEALRRAIENVVRNAARFTAEGTDVAVTLAVEEDRIVVAVRDHGAGVPEEALPHLFEPFYRAAEDRDRMTGGVGLGLAIVDRAVRIHGGVVTATSAPGGGLDVVICLPKTGRSPSS